MGLFFGIKKHIFFLFILVYHEGKTETECDATKGTILECKFPENISSTQKDFTVYFDSEDDSAELLVDCIWMHQHLQCIEQEGFKCNQPVSDTAIINVPLRYTKRSGTYRCVPEGSSDKDIKSCRCPESKLGQQSENQNKSENVKQQDTSQNKINTNHSDPEEDATAVLIGSIVGALFGILALILFIGVLCKKFFKRNLQNPKSERPSSEEEVSFNIMETKAKDVELMKVKSDVSVTSSHQEHSLEVIRENSFLLQKVVDSNRLSFVSE